MQPQIAPLSFSIESFSACTGIGRTTIFAAIKDGELRARRPVQNGRVLRKIIILREDGEKWLYTFPFDKEVK